MPKPSLKTNEKSPDLHAIRERARAAFRAIRALSVAERLERIRRLRLLLLDEREAIIPRLCAETKKVATDALVSEIFSVLDHLHYLEKNAATVLADAKVPTPLALMGKQSRVYYQPLGTILVISPWNYPLYLGLVPATAAFVAGNAVIFKPSEHTPLEGLFESLLSRGGFEKDWIQVVYGDGEIGSQLVDLKPEKIFFVGSAATGKKILGQAAASLTPVVLELGGKDPMIVFEDANLDRAAAGALWGGLTNHGQSCTSVEKIYVQRTVYEKFKALLVQRARMIKPGEDLGRMTAAFQVETVRRQIEDARAKGAKLLTGEQWDGKSDAIPPLILEGVSEESLLMKEETFGPVLPLIPFSDEKEGVAAANRTEFGLSASVWTADSARGERVARALEVGNVSVNNVMLTEGNPALPFGGVKASGFGRYKGAVGLHAFCNVKSVLYDKNSAKHEAHWFPYTPEKYRLFGELVEALFRGKFWGIARFLLTGLRLEGLASKLRSGRAK